MEELTKLMHEMWFNNEISKEAYAKLLIFTNTHNNLQLLQTDVVGRSEQLKAEQEAYNSGYKDGAQAAVNDILG